MFKRDISAMVSIGVNIVAAALCAPSGFDALSAFYRAIILYIIGLLVTELPKWGQNSQQPRWRSDLQCGLFIVCFGLIGIGFTNISSKSTVAPKDSQWVWLYFIVSLFMLSISLINNLEVAAHRAPTQPIPPVLGLGTALHEEKKRRQRRR